MKDSMTETQRFQIESKLYSLEAQKNVLLAKIDRLNTQVNQINAKQDILRRLSGEEVQLPSGSTDDQNTNFFSNGYQSNF